MVVTNQKVHNLHHSQDGPFPHYQSTLQLDFFTNNYIEQSLINTYDGSPVYQPQTAKPKVAHFEDPDTFFDLGLLRVFEDPDTYANDFQQFSAESLNSTESGDSFWMHYWCTRGLQCKYGDPELFEISEYVLELGAEYQKTQTLM